MIRNILLPVILIPHHKAPGFLVWSQAWVTICVTFHMFSKCHWWFSVWVLQFLSTSQKHPVRWSDYSKLPLGANKSGWCPATDWCPIRGAFLPQCSWIPSDSVQDGAMNEQKWHSIFHHWWNWANNIVIHVGKMNTIPPLLQKWPTENMSEVDLSKYKCWFYVWQP